MSTLSKRVSAIVAVLVLVFAMAVGVIPAETVEAGYTEQGLIYINESGEFVTSNADSSAVVSVEANFTYTDGEDAQAVEFERVKAYVSPMVSYDAASKTITLNNAILGGLFIYKNDITIKIVGTNAISQTGEGFDGFCVNEGVTGIKMTGEAGATFTINYVRDIANLEGITLDGVTREDSEDDGMKTYVYRAGAKDANASAAEKLAAAENGNKDRIGVPAGSSVRVKGVNALTDATALSSLQGLVATVENATNQGVLQVFNFDIDATGSGKIIVNVGTAYANNIAIVGHYKNGKWTTQQVRVDANGYVYPTFGSFSPVSVIVTNQTTAINSIPTTENFRTTSPATSDSLLVYSLTTVIALAGGMLILGMKKSR